MGIKFENNVLSISGNLNQDDFEELVLNTHKESFMNLSSYKIILFDIGGDLSIVKMVDYLKNKLKDKNIQIELLGVLRNYAISFLFLGTLPIKISQYAKTHFAFPVHLKEGVELNIEEDLDRYGTAEQLQFWDWVVVETGSVLDQISLEGTMHAKELLKMEGVNKWENLSLLETNASSMADYFYNLTFDKKGV